MWGEGRGVSRGWTGGMAYVVCPLFSCVECRGPCAAPCFCFQHPVLILTLALQKYHFFFSSYLLVKNLPQLHMYTVIFSHIIVSFYFVVQKVCPGANFAVLQQKCPGSRLVSVPATSLLFLCLIWTSRA